MSDELTVRLELPPRVAVELGPKERRSRDLRKWLRARHQDRFADYRGVERPEHATNALFDSLCEEAQDWLTGPNPTPTQVCPLMAHAVHRWVDSLA